MNQDQIANRRVAIVLMLAGVGLALVGVAMFISYAEVHPSAPIPRSDPMTVEQKLKMAEHLQMVLFYTIVLIGVFVVASLAFLRWSRAYRRRLLRKPRPPTPADDVWAMHKLPEGLDPAAEPESAAGELGDGPDDEGQAGPEDGEFGEGEAEDGDSGNDDEPK